MTTFRTQRSIPRTPLPAARPRLVAPLLLTIFLVAATAWPAAGAEATTQETRSTAKLVADTGYLQPGRIFRLGVLIKLAPGWHTYWKQPGDAGAAPRVTWKLPEGFTAGELLWPYPRRFGTPPVVSFGYEDSVLLTARVRPPDRLATSKTCNLGVEISWLICSELCLPRTADLNLVLPVGPGAGQAKQAPAALFRDNEKRLPRRSAGWQFKAVLRERTVSLMVEPASPVPAAAWQGADFFPLQPGRFRYKAAPAWTVRDHGFLLSLAADADLAGDTALEGVLVLPAAAVDAPTPRALIVSAPYVRERKTEPSEQASAEHDRPAARHETR